MLNELVHIKEHLKKGEIENIFDDLDINDNEIEREADEKAAEFLIPNNVWETALPRYYRTKDNIISFASEIGISPAIVAGKIRKETGNYNLFGDMIGQGKAREQFSKVEFSY